MSDTSAERLAPTTREAAQHRRGSSVPSSVYQGQEVQFEITNWSPKVLGNGPYTTAWTIKPDPSSPTSYTYSNVVAVQIPPDGTSGSATFTWDTSEVEPGTYVASVAVTNSANKSTVVTPDQPEGGQVTVKLRPVASSDTIPVTMRRTAEAPTSDEALWVAIRNSTNALSFQNYVQYIDPIMCCPGRIDAKCYRPTTATTGREDDCALPPLSQRRYLPFPDVDAYRVLKVATECFLMWNCGVYLDRDKLNKLLRDPNYDLTEDAGRLNQNVTGLPDAITKWWNAYLASGNQYLNPNDPQNTIIPYLALVRSRLADLGVKEDYQMGIQCYGILRGKLINPCLIELIWSYWHEEGMLVQTMNAVSQRFQNLRAPGDRDPLARFDIDPLRPLNNLLWGYIQDEQHRLTVRRRAYTYLDVYGLTMEGKAVAGLRPAESRSKFLEAFHNLLYLCTIFFKEDDDTTVVADGFPVLNALKEVHYVLAEGANNQFGDLPTTARQEMLIQEWLLARPEMREFLGGKIMVPYPEEWMDRVDNVKSMKGWTDVSVVYFRNLAVYGEQILLSIRYGAWSITNSPAQAANWARYWRPEIQAYIHGYRAATGVDITTEPVNSTLPSVLLIRRLAMQRPVAR